MVQEQTNREGLAGALHGAEAGMAVITIDGTVEHVNAALARQLGLDAPALVGRRCDDGLVEDSALDRHCTRRLLEGRSGGYQREAVLQGADGRRVGVQATVTLVRDETGRPHRWLAVVLPLGERAQAEDDMRALADLDPLTGAFNRRRLDYEMRRAIANGRRYGTSTTLLLLDVDHLKAVNDTHGHLAGDDLLCSVADILRRRLRQTDLLARYGGDEFAVLLPNTGAERARRVAEDLLEAVRCEAVMADSTPVRATLSAGAATTIAGRPADPRDLVREADEALYAAKGAGRDRVA